MRATLAVLSASVFCLPAFGQSKPDLSGFWQGPLLRNMDKNVPGGFAAIFTPGVLVRVVTGSYKALDLAVEGASADVADDPTIASVLQTSELVG